MPRSPMAPAVMAALVVLAACGSPPDWPATAVAAVAADLASCASAPHVAGQPPGPSDWPVYHRTGDRRGVDPGAAAGRRVTPLWGARLDGSMFAEPLVVQGVVIEATEHDSVYALDEATGCLIWRMSLGAPFDVTRHVLLCNNITPELGVTATPAVDPLTGTVYVVAFLDPGRYELDALDLGSGAIRWRHPIDLPGSNVLQQLSRPALALANGRVYASFGGRAGDCDVYRGFVVGVSVDGTGTDARYQAAAAKAAVWAPGGPVALPGGDLLVAVGNSDELQRYDGSNAVVRLTPDLRRTDLFAAANWAHLNRVDLDLGSVGPTVLDDRQVFQVGKDGVGYLLDLDHLGGVGGQRFQRSLTGGCYAIGATAYRAPYVYVPCDHSLTAVRVSGGRFDVAWRGPDFRSGSPILAAGLVWDFDFEGGIVWGFDPATGAVRQRVAVGIGEHFVSVSSSAGRLFVPARNRLYAFSLSG
jgi:putative pyrroloquinoline-quinone binding quinoprotein